MDLEKRIQLVEEELDNETNPERKMKLMSTYTALIREYNADFKNRVEWTKVENEDRRESKRLKLDEAELEERRRQGRKVSPNTVFMAAVILLSGFVGVITDTFANRIRTKRESDTESRLFRMFK